LISFSLKALIKFGNNALTIVRYKTASLKIFIALGRLAPFSLREIMLVLFTPKTSTACFCLILWPFDISEEDLEF